MKLFDSSVIQKSSVFVRQYRVDNKTGFECNTYKLTLGVRDVVNAKDEQYA